MGNHESLELAKSRNEMTLLNFLQIDLDLGRTFAALASLRADMGKPDAARRILGKAEQGYETIERFSLNIQDPGQQNDIRRRLGELRSVLDAAHQHLDPGASPQTGK